MPCQTGQNTALIGRTSITLTGDANAIEVALHQIHRAAAKSEEVELPWSRGANRQAMIERRQQDRTATQQAKTA